MATLPEDEITLVYGIRKTVMEMLRDRGYEVADDEVEMTRAQFIQKYGDNMKRDDLKIITQSMSNSSDKIYAFFPDEDMVGTAAVKNYAAKMEEHNVQRAILVVKHELTPLARTWISEIFWILHFEVFQEAELQLLVNAKNNVHATEHLVLSPEEQQSLLENYQVKDTDQMPCIQATDPIARYYGMRPGQVVKIIRSGEVAGISYRRVV